MTVNIDRMKGPIASFLQSVAKWKSEDMVYQFFRYVIYSKTTFEVVRGGVKRNENGHCEYKIHHI